MEQNIIVISRQENGFFSVYDRGATLRDLTVETINTLIEQYSNPVLAIYGRMKHTFLYNGDKITELKLAKKLEHYIIHFKLEEKYSLSRDIYAFDFNEAVEISKKLFNDSVQYITCLEKYEMGSM